MDVSDVIESTTTAVPSPNGHYIASSTPTTLTIHYAQTLNHATTFPLPSSTPQTTAQITWTPDSLHILHTTSTNLTLFSLDNTSSKLQISNGSGSLGRIIAAETFGSSILVVWEFGRVGLCDVDRGRVTEIGELKTGLGGLRGSWCVRRSDGVARKAEVLALLSRTTAQDVLTIFLPSMQAPLKTTTLPTSDAQTLLWSPCGNWLSILDTSLSAPNPSLHIYTPDGNHYRSWPQVSSPETLLGPQRQAWGPKNLALGYADGSVTLLDTRTFSQETRLGETLEPPSSEPTYYTETISRQGDRSWKFSRDSNNNNNSHISETISSSQTTHLKFDSAGQFLAVKHEHTPETITIWHLQQATESTNPTAETMAAEHATTGEEETPLTLLRSHTALRTTLWHPKTPGLLLLIAEDNTVTLWNAKSENAPTTITHPFSSSSSATASSSTSTSVQSSNLGQSPSQTVTATFLLHQKSDQVSVLVSAKKRGWCIVYPFGRPELVGASDVAEEEEGDDSQDSLYDILSGRTPLPALKISDDVEGGDEGFEDGDDRLEDTFRGKGTVDTVDDFEY